MPTEPEQNRTKDDSRARRAAEHPLETGAKPESGDEKMVRNRFAAPIVVAVIAVVVVLAFILL